MRMEPTVEFDRTDDQKRRRSSPHRGRLERWEVKRRAFGKLCANIMSQFDVVMIMKLYLIRRCGGGVRVSS
jgi:hypothetical protein